MRQVCKARSLSALLCLVHEASDFSPGGLVLGPARFCAGSEEDPQGTGSRPVPPGIREHPRHDMRVSDLLRDETHERRSLPVRFHECWRRLLPQEVSGLGSVHRLSSSIF